MEKARFLPKIVSLISIVVLLSVCAATTVASEQKEEAVSDASIQKSSAPVNPAPAKTKVKKKDASALKTPTTSQKQIPVTSQKEAKKDSTDSVEKSTATANTTPAKKDKKKPSNEKKKATIAFNKKDQKILKQINKHFNNAIKYHKAGKTTEVHIELNDCVKTAGPLMIKDLQLYITLLYARDNYTKSNTLDEPTIEHIHGLINKYKKK